MSTITAERVRVGTLADLNQRGCTVVSAGEHGMRTLGHAVLRENAEFHGYQTLEAGVRQFTALQAEHPLAARRTLASVTRYIAAHAPTPRAMNQTYQIAVRLLRGDDLTVADESAT